MLTLMIGAALAAIIFYYLFIKPLNYWKDRGVKQGNPIWFFGDNWRMFFRLQSFGEMIEFAYKQNPNTRYSGIYLFSVPTLVIKDPDLLKQLTIKDFDHFTDHRSFTSVNAEPLLARNLAALKGEKWREMRIVLTPSFTSSKMKSMFGLIAENCEDFVQYFLKKDQDIITMEMKDAFTRFTNDVIATTAFGVKVDSFKERNNEFYLMGKRSTDFSGIWKSIKFFGYFICPKLFEIFKIKLFEEGINTFFLELVNETIKTREEQGIVRPDMINILMEARKGIHKHEENGAIDTGFATANTEESDIEKSKTPREITNTDIAAQALVFFFAGFDSVSNLMCFLCYELAVNEDIQQKLRNEVLATFEECKGKLTYEGLLKMKYMDMVVSETLRKWPNAPATDRVCTKPYTIEPVTPEETPLHVEEGTLLWLPIFGIHRNPEYYPNPERFDPERFSDENKGNIQPYTYFPFGLGPRNCIGSRFALLETKSVFFYILLHFQIIPVEKTKIPLKLSTKSFNMTAEGGFWLGLKRIKL